MNFELTEIRNSVEQKLKNLKKLYSTIKDHNGETG